MCERCGILFKLPGSKYCIQHKEKKLKRIITLFRSMGFRSAKSAINLSSMDFMRMTNRHHMVSRRVRLKRTLIQASSRMMVVGRIMYVSMTSKVDSDRSEFLQKFYENESIDLISQARKS